MGRPSEAEEEFHMLLLFGGRAAQPRQRALAEQDGGSWGCFGEEFECDTDGEDAWRQELSFT